MIISFINQRRENMPITHKCRFEMDAYKKFKDWKINYPFEGEEWGRRYGGATANRMALFFLSLEDEAKTYDDIEIVVSNADDIAFNPTLTPAKDVDSKIRHLLLERMKKKH